MASGFSPVPRTTPSVVSGVRSTDLIGSYRQVIQMDDEIHNWEEEVSPLLTLTNKLRAPRTVNNHTFYWMEEEPYPRAVTLAADATSGAATLSITTGQGARIPKYSLYQNQTTNEIVRITSMSTDTATVTRAIGGVNEAMVAGQTLVRIASAFEDGTTIGDIKSVKQGQLSNECQIIRTAVGWTRRDAATEMYGGTDPETTKASMGREHKKDMEFTYFFGKTHSMTGSDGKLVTMAGGLRQFIQSNYWNVGGYAPTKEQWNANMAAFMRWGKNGYRSGKTAVKWAFMSSSWVTVFDSYVQNELKYEVLGEAEVMGKGITIGVKVARYRCSHGELMLVRQPLFDEVAPGTMVIVDLSEVRPVKHKNGGTMYLTDRQDPSADGTKEEWLSDFSVQVTVEASHTWIDGLPAGL